jgi:proline dehydrogenase
MRRLAERPQNINLIVKDVFYDSNNKLKKKPLVIAAGAATFLCLLRKRKNSGK